jgi:phosphatidylglycerophosphatase C
LPKAVDRSTDNEHMAEPRGVAAFDFDGTLTRRDSLVPFLARVVGWPRLALAAATGIRHARSRNAFKEHLVDKVFRGRAHDDVRRLGLAYAEELVARRMRPEMLARVRWHGEQGHEIAIVSASLDVYLERVAELLGVAAVLCTRIEVGPDGRCTGRLVGQNCRGDEKLRRIHAHFGDDGYELWAYGDSAGDDAMLAAADHPTHL